MKANPIIFKSYDIRGIYPSEINEDAVFDIGRNFIRHSRAKRVALCYDARISSPALLKALARGIYAQGGEVHSIGQLPTECLYFAVGTYNFDSGIMITASHNPKEYNGLKMMRKQGNDIQMVRGKDLISSITESDYLEENEGTDKNIDKKDVLKDYLNHVFSFIDLSEIVPLKVIIDASSGVAGNVISEIKDKLPIEIIPLNFKPDGSFPNHGPNPLEDGSSREISEMIKNHKADFGLMFDGDADRIFLVDENGLLVKADATLLLLAKYFLEKNPNAAVAYNAICSKAVPEFIEKWGGKPVRTQVGFVNVREGLMKNNGIMGGELSGHYCFKDNFYMDSGIISFLVLLQVISKDGRKVSEIVKELSPYAKGAELNFKVQDKEAMIEKVKAKYSDLAAQADGKVDFLDGVTVEYKDWWFNVRASNTEPLLRLTIEADSQDILETKQKELTKFIQK